MEITTVKKGLNANALKLIAIIAMTVDHLLWAFFPGHDNAPWFCFYIALAE